MRTNLAKVSCHFALQEAGPWGGVQVLLVPRLQSLMICSGRDRMQGYVPDNGIRLLHMGCTSPSLAFAQDSAPEGQGHVIPSSSTCSNTAPVA